MPLPFTRELTYSKGGTMETGKDVFVLQSLLNRSPSSVGLEADGDYGAASADAVATFQTYSALNGVTPGVFDNITGAQLRCHVVTIVVVCLLDLQLDDTIS